MIITMDEVRELQKPGVHCRLFKKGLTSSLSMAEAIAAEDIRARHRLVQLIEENLLIDVRPGQLMVWQTDSFINDAIVLEYHWRPSPEAPWDVDGVIFSQPPPNDLAWLHGLQVAKPVTSWYKSDGFMLATTTNYVLDGYDLDNDCWTTKKNGAT